MPTLTKYKTPLIVVVVACVLYLGYVNFWPADGELPLLGSTSGQPTNHIDADLLKTLSETRQIKLDSTLFETAAFKSLQDFAQVIPAQLIGRENPFESLTGGAAIVKPR